MKRFFTFLIVSIFLYSCSKDPILSEQREVQNKQNNKLTLDLESEAISSPTLQTGFTLHTIKKGTHSSDKSTLKSIKTSEMRFYAYFDLSSEYKSILPENQYDINKLWGFTEGFNNQYNSCRIGWSYNDGLSDGDIAPERGKMALRLYAYSYSKGVRNSKVICTVPINTQVYCRIKPNTNLTYTCEVTSGGTTYSATVPRGTTSTSASGYQQYPYFGGDELAPHNVFIQIKSVL